MDIGLEERFDGLGERVRERAGWHDYCDDEMLDFD